MPIHFEPRPHPEMEALYTLGLLVRRELPDVLMENLPEGTAPETLAEVGAMVEPISGLLAEVEQLVDLEDEDFRFLFKEHEELESPLAFVVHLCGLAGVPNGLYMYLMDDYHPDPSLADGPEEREALLQYIHRAEKLSGETKYDLVHLLHDFRRYKAVLDGLLAETWGVIERHLPVFEADTERLLAETQQGLAQQGMAYLEKWVGVRLDNGDDFALYPSIVHYNALTLSTYAPFGPNILSLGIHLRRLIEITDAAKAEDGLLDEFAKALADPTKRSILQKLGRRRYYSSELAAALSLTGPTISHHMNALVKLHLAIIEKQGNRIYYELDKAILGQYFERLRAELLG